MTGKMNCTGVNGLYQNKHSLSEERILSADLVSGSALSSSHRPHVAIPI